MKAGREDAEAVAALSQFNQTMQGVEREFVTPALKARFCDCTVQMLEHVKKKYEEPMPEHMRGPDFHIWIASRGFKAQADIYFAHANKLHREYMTNIHHDLLESRYASLLVGFYLLSRSWRNITEHDMRPENFGRSASLLKHKIRDGIGELLRRHGFALPW